MEVPDQQKLWDKKHAAGEHAAHRDSILPFAHTVAGFLFSGGGCMLEIGCGVGADAHFFAERGFDVLATDVSQVVVDQDKAYFNDPRLTFEQLDVTRPLPFTDESFAIVYSHLALHYYDDRTTPEVFAELHRILKPGGILAFACKSVDDSRYGEGERIGPDMFVARGHVRHFFSVDYAADLLDGAYDIKLLESTSETYNDGLSGFIYCVATKRETEA